MSDTVFDVSVIIPLARDHGRLVECVRSWSQEQILERSRFEVIVIGDGPENKLAAKARDLLAPHDSVLHFNSQNEFRLYQVAAERARGALLFFAECHSRATPDCLAEMLSYLNDRQLAGARSRSTPLPIGNTRLATLDVIAFEREDATYLVEDHWRKVLVHGFAIRKETYFAAGGFEYEYGQFSQLALAAKLHAAGIKLGYCATSTVQHYYDGNLPESQWLSQDNNRGEILYRSRNPAEFCEHYFGKMLEWSSRGSYRTQSARSLIRTLLKGGDSRLLPERVSSLVSTVPAAALGTRPARIRLILARYKALAESWRWRGDNERSYQAHRRYLDTLFFYYRNEAIDSYMSDFRLPETEACRYELSNMDEERLFGFQPLEEREGELFRWSKAASLVQVTLPIRNYELELTVFPFRITSYPLRLNVLLDGNVLPRVPTDPESGLLRFRIEADQFTPGSKHHDLTLICNKMPNVLPGEPERGLPLRAIEFQAAD